MQFDLSISSRAEDRSHVFRIYGQKMIVEVDSRTPNEHLYAVDNRIYWVWIPIAGFATPERTAEVWEQLNLSINAGAESFTMPQK